MLDWSNCEVEDIVWDEFSENDDHTVPHPGGEEVDSTGQVDRHKRPRCEVSYPFTSNSNGQYADKDALHRKDETSLATVKDLKAPMLGKGSWSCTTDGDFPASSDTDSFKGLSGLTADGTELPVNCFNGNRVDSTSNEFCADDPILGYRNAAISSNLCHFPLGDISSTSSDLEFLGNEHEDKANSDLYYWWPDIGNFEDVDRMFRSCDSTFGQGNTGHDEELSCFSSSSHAIDGSEDALKSGLKSSSSDSNELRSISKHHEPDNNFTVDTVTPLINDSDKDSAANNHKIDLQASYAFEPATFSHVSYVSWSDANAPNGAQSKSIEQINLQNQQLEHQNQSEGKRENQSSELNGDGSFYDPGPFQQFANMDLPPSIPSSLHVFPSLDIPPQQENLIPNFSNSLHTELPYVQPKYKGPSNQTPVTPISSTQTENIGHPSVSSKSSSFSSKASSFASNHAQCMERSPDSSPTAAALKLEKRVGKPFQQRQLLHAKLTGDPQQNSGMRAAFTNQTSTQKYSAQIHNDIVAHKEFKGTAVELPVEDSSTVQQSSCVGSALSDVVSVEETSFGQLQYIMEQLDIRTKLCIRDGLYRLARSAEQRHNIGSLNGCSRNCSAKSRVLKTEEPNKYTRFVDMEADTNPIDRSIARLLFYTPPNVSTRATSDVLSQESHAMLHGSISIQPAMTEKLVPAKEIAGGAGTELRTDQ